MARTRNNHNSQQGEKMSRKYQNVLDEVQKLRERVSRGLEYYDAQATFYSYPFRRGVYVGARDTLRDTKELLDEILNSQKSK